MRYLTAAPQLVYTPAMTEAKPLLAIIVYDLTATGVVRNAIRIASGIAAHGLTTEVWVMRNAGEFKKDVPTGVSIIEIGIPRPLGHFAANRRLISLSAVPRIARLIAERKPTVLLSAGNHFHLAAGLAYRWAGRLPSTRFLGRASNATPRLGRYWAQGGAVANFIDAMKYREMHHIIAVSHELAADMSKYLGIDAARISVIPNGIDVAQVEREADEPLDDPWFSPGSPPVIISAGRISRQKNYELLLDAFALLRRKHTARLVILGDGPARARRALLDRAARLGVSEDFRLPGYEPNPIRYFSRASLFVLSSRWEGASNVLLEALACGCPVVATDCPTGVREQLDNGRIGPIVPINDPEGLAGAMARRLEEPRGSKGLIEYVARFDHDRMLLAYEQLFKSEMKDA
ncbi:MAG TPA: glycosyltransferase [Aestuariivirga sp.]|nr:glycosyltransferase [Aestuariivirga sp.]